MTMMLMVAMMMITRSLNLARKFASLMRASSSLRQISGSSPSSLNTNQSTKQSMMTNLPWWWSCKSLCRAFLLHHTWLWTGLWIPIRPHRFRSCAMLALDSLQACIDSGNLEEYILTDSNMLFEKLTQLPSRPEGFTGISISSFVWPELFRAVVIPIWTRF